VQTTLPLSHFLEQSLGIRHSPQQVILAPLEPSLALVAFQGSNVLGSLQYFVLVPASRVLGNDLASVHDSYL